MESRKKSLKNLKKRLDKPPDLCYNKNVPRERGTVKPLKKSLKNLKKRLDKSLDLWYNKYIKGNDTLQTRKDLIL